MFVKNLRWLLLCLALFAAALGSTILRPLNLAKLEGDSDVVVLGQVLSVVGQGASRLDLGSGPIEAVDYDAALRIDYVLKGGAKSQTLTLRFSIPNMPLGLQAVTSGQYGIFFLTNSQNRLRFTDPMYPCLPAINRPKAPAGSVIDQVTVIVGESLESGLLSVSDRYKALDALSGLQTPLAHNVLRHALTSTSIEVRLDVARSLVAHDDIAGLELVEHALNNPSGLTTETFSNLAGSLAGLRNPESVPALRRLLTLSDQRITRAAVVALRQSHSSSALQPLSSQLGNPEQQVRYYAVVGLGEITGQDEWTPSYNEFTAHESKYVEHWREWAASNTSVINASPKL